MFGSLFLKGLIIGIMVSVPLGPIGLLVIQKTVNKNRLAGFISGIGVALADSFYAIIAGFSLTFILDFLKKHELLFQIIGGLILVILGLSIYFKNPVKDFKKYRKKGNGYFQDLIFTFLLTLSNPATVFIFIAVLTGSGVVLSIKELSEAFFIILGVFSGGSLWWLILTRTVSIFRHRFNLRLLWWFNKIAGVIIISIVVIAAIVLMIQGK
jgi:threonine/homoserine/homoserine lactone efflux protein